MKAAELRKTYLQFFADREHKLFSSDLLVPANDPTLLFTSAGMTQFKDYFLGRNKSARRATSCQKCLRTGDLDRVGKTACHHTFFEMLGNFSFGDYFKQEAIVWAWEFVTLIMNIKPSNLWVTVYTDDDEAYDIWTGKIGVPPDRITRLGANDNFWPQNALAEGPDGPCGPCSEIYFDYGPSFGGGDPGTNSKRFVEFWNLVFTQFNRIGVNKTEPLPAKNIDTGMGLERMAAILQGKQSNYDIDILRPIVDEAGRLIRSEDRFKLNAITDHVRALAFCIADGVYPSNEDRGYVVRKILRRAVWFGFSSGRKDPFLHELVDLVVDLMKDPYSELVAKQDTIKKVILSEEERFLKTIDKGRDVLYGYVSAAQEEKRERLAGDEVFRLYDTYGFPFELTDIIASEKGLGIDAESFKQLLERQKELSRQSSKFEGSVFVKGELCLDERSEFSGYTCTIDTSVVSSIIKGDQTVEACSAGEEIGLVLKQTPFYATKGGQVHDTGTITSDRFVFDVTSVDYSDEAIVHRGVLRGGDVKVGDSVRACVDVNRRNAIRRAHTATHLLQAALRRVLGAHIQQQGSYVDEDYLRFDFNHFKAVQADEIARIEELVNGFILDNALVGKETMTIDQARERGALAFFEDKYGEEVRVITIKGISSDQDISMELCGGTHLDHTSEIGSFVVTAEGSVASGVRRIEALTGRKAYETLAASRRQVKSIADLLKTPLDSAGDAVRELNAERKLQSRQIQNMRQVLFEKVDAAEIVRSPVSVGNCELIMFSVASENSGFLKTAIDIVRGKAGKNAVIAGYVVASDKLTINISRTGDMASDISCKRIAELLAATLKASGGGKEQFGFCGMKLEAAFDEDFLRQTIRDAVKEACL